MACLKVYQQLIALIRWLLAENSTECEIWPLTYWLAVVCVKSANTFLEAAFRVFFACLVLWHLAQELNSEWCLRLRVAVFMLILGSYSQVFAYLLVLCFVWENSWPYYLISRCSVILLSWGQNFMSSSRSGLFLRFLVVVYRDTPGVRFSEVDAVLHSVHSRVTIIRTPLLLAITIWHFV